MFDPWTADAEGIRAAQQEFASRPGGSFFRSPIAQADAAQSITAERALIESDRQGSGFALLAAVRNVLAHELIAPDWLVHAYTRRYDRVLNCHADSWDDPAVFGRPYRKGLHLAALRKARQKRMAVLFGVRDALDRDPSLAIGPALFGEVGKALGLGKTLAETYYYEARAILDRMGPQGRKVFKSGRRVPASSANFAGSLPRKR